MPKAVKKKKSQLKPIQGVKNDLLVGVVKIESSPRFASNGIHTKSRPDNLLGNSLEKGPRASQVPIRRGSQNPVLKTLLNTSKR